MSDYFSKQIGSDYFRESSTEVPETQKKSLKDDRFKPDVERYKKNQTRIVVKRYVVEQN